MPPAKHPVGRTTAADAFDDVCLITKSLCGLHGRDLEWKIWYEYRNIDKRHLVLFISVCVLRTINIECSNDGITKKNIS